MTEVTLSAKEACQNYALGFALGCFLASTMVAAVAIYSLIHWPEQARTPLIMFVITSIAGCVSLALSYTFPVRFYETLEQREISE